MAGTATLVTGGTGGIGRATAVGLAALGARVGITGRDTARTQAAAAAIARESGNLCVDAFAADMSCQAEVRRRLAAAVLDTYPRLDVLVNNVAGCPHVLCQAQPGDFGVRRRRPGWVRGGVDW